MNQHRWWLFSWNMAPVPITGTSEQSPKYMVENFRPPGDRVMPYMYDMQREAWWRWANLADKWIAEAYWPREAPCKKNAVELLLLKG